MRSWLFGILLSESVNPLPDPELLAVSAVLHDLGLTARYAAEERFEVDGANAARAFLKERGISAQQMQLVWDAIALHTTRSIALHKEPEVVMTHSGIAVDAIGAGLDRIPPDKLRAILAEFLQQFARFGHVAAINCRSNGRLRAFVDWAKFRLLFIRNSPGLGLLLLNLTHRAAGY